MTGVALAAILLPFAGAVLALFGGRWAAWFALPPVLAGVPLTAVVALWQGVAPGVRLQVYGTVPTGSAPITAGLYVDGTAAVVAFMVACVALAVQVYSLAYLRRDPRYPSYAAFVSLFTAAMLLVVYSGDLLVLYAGWEVMGLCSYFLIGHHRADRAATRAATKAFLVTRAGDVPFLFGLLVLGVGAHSFRLSTVLAAVPDLPHGTRLAAALLLLGGVAGKSAQFPLHSWLPDAMVGPTPVSALIHAATMVAAGIYLVARLYPLYLAEPAARNVLAVMACVSMVGAALAALVQPDLKRVLAYSTISQLGLMAAALAAGSRTAAVYHLLAHGAFKALLFLAAGCVFTAVGSTALPDLGGLRRTMPVTFWSMTAGWAALVGVPPVSGFFTKDTVVEAVWQHGWALTLCVLATVALTAAYATRAWLMTFFGEPRHTVRTREAPRLMRWPVAALAVPALAAGLPSLWVPALRPHALSTLVALLCAAAGFGWPYLRWLAAPALDPLRGLPRLPAVRLDPTRPVLAAAGLVAVFDTAVLGRAVGGVPALVGWASGRLRVTANGDPQAYLTGLVTGAVLIVALVAVLV